MIRWNAKTGHWSDPRLREGGLCDWLIQPGIIGQTGGPTLGVTVDGAAYPSGTVATIAYVTASAHPVGSLMVLLFSVGSQTISSVVDTRSNTWTAQASNPSGASRHYLYTSILTTALQVGDTITITLSTATGRRACALVRIDNGTLGAALDASGVVNNIGTTTSPAVTTSAATTNARDVVFGAYGSNTTGITFVSESAGWTAIGDGLTSGGTLVHYSYTIVSATGTQTFLITINTGSSGGELLVVALKGT